MQRRFVMAIEASAATARCVVADFEGAVLGCGVGAPEADAVGAWRMMESSLRGAVTAALAAVAGDVAEVDAVVVGASGIGVAGERADELEAFLAELLPGAARVRAVPDLVIAFWGALSMPVGVVVSASNGSACFGRNLTGESCYIGGWGPLLGDEGSAYDIGRQALRAVARAEDGRGRGTSLSHTFLRAFDVHDIGELAIKLDADGADRSVVAGLLPHVIQAARRADPVAQQILQGAARDLAIAVATALRRLRLIDMRTSVTFCGDVFEAGRNLIDPFTRAVQEASPQAKIEPPLLPPIGGAFRLALQAISVTMDDPIVHRFAKGLVRHGW